MSNEKLTSSIEVLRYRYRYLTKSQKGAILAGLEERFSIDRKYLIRLLGRQPSGRPRNPKRRGCPSKYSEYAFERALRQVWKITNFMCGRYLKEAMPDWLPSIERKHGAFAPEIHELLLTISAASIDRHLRPFKALHGKSLTRPNNAIRKEIPVQGNIWDTTVPGYIECDTVAHCGGSMLGDFVNSVTTVDIATTWTEVRAAWGRGSSGVLEQLKDIEKTLPFTILGYDADNGGEVLNMHVIKYFRERKIPATVTRSRSYNKNDNAHVEQKNNSVARRYIGYERLDCQQLLPLINHYYADILCPLLNHFYPSNKLKDKRLVESKRKRYYDKPCTPYARVMASPEVSEQAKDELHQLHEALDPVELRIHEQKVRKQIDSAMKQFRSTRQNSGSIIQDFHHQNVRILFDNP